MGEDTKKLGLFFENLLWSSHVPKKSNVIMTSDLKSRISWSICRWGASYVLLQCISSWYGDLWTKNTIISVPFSTLIHPTSTAGQRKGTLNTLIYEGEEWEVQTSHRPQQFWSAAGHMLPDPSSLETANALDQDLDLLPGSNSHPLFCLAPWKYLPICHLIPVSMRKQDTLEKISALTGLNT